MSYLQPYSFDFLCMFVKYVFPDEVWSPEFLSTQRTQPLVFRQLLGIGFNELFNFSENSQEKQNSFFQDNKVLINGTKIRSWRLHLDYRKRGT